MRNILITVTITFLGLFYLVITKIDTTESIKKQHRITTDSLYIVIDSLKSDNVYLDSALINSKRYTQHWLNELNSCIEQNRKLSKVIRTHKIKL